MILVKIPTQRDAERINNKDNFFRIRWYFERHIRTPVKDNVRDKIWDEIKE